MNKFTLASIVMLAVLLNVSVFAGDAEPGTLSDQEIAALKQNFTDTATKKSWTWSGTFTQNKLSAADAAKAKSTMKIPYRITGALYEVIDDGGKKTMKRESGTCYIFIKDAEGNVVFKTTQPLDKMCPS